VVSLGKIEALFRDTFGLRVTRGGISQALARLGRKAKPSYQELVQQLRRSPFVIPFSAPRFINDWTAPNPRLFPL